LTSTAEAVPSVKIDVRPNWKEQPRGPSLTGKQLVNAACLMTTVDAAELRARHGQAARFRGLQVCQHSYLVGARIAGRQRSAPEDAINIARRK
jgi:hypothetical protein